MTIKIFIKVKSLLTKNTKNLTFLITIYGKNGQIRYIINHAKVTYIYNETNNFS